MAQTNHSELMNDMDRTTHDLIRLMTAFGRVSAERYSLQDNITTLSQDNFTLRCELERVRQEATDDKEMYSQILNEKNLTLHEEEKYADNLHDSLSEVKVSLRKLSDELAAEKEISSQLRAENQRLQQTHDAKRAEIDQVRYDLCVMYRMRDQAATERDRLMSELSDMIADRDHAIAQRDRAVEEYDQSVEARNEDIALRDKVIAERDEALKNYKSACTELRDEYNAHTASILEANQLLSRNLSSSSIPERPSYRDYIFHVDDDQDSIS
jgi:uncharacterized protein (DUF3084 family)